MSTRQVRQQRLTAVLGVTLVALTVAVIAIAWNDRRALESASFVEHADAGTASRILIARPARPDLVLERHASAWAITAPCRISADIDRITPLLAALSTSPLTYRAREVDRDAAGLVEPLAVITIDDDVIELGGTDLAGERRYAQRGDTVALVPEWVLSLADGGLSALAVRRLFTTPPTTLTRADGQSLDADAWAGLSANQVVAWPLPDAPPTRQAQALTASVGDAPNVELELVATDSWTAIVTSGESCARLFAPDDMPRDASA